MRFNYSTKYDAEKEARAIGLGMRISTKHSVEVCRMLRGMELQKAKDLLQKVLEKKVAVPYRRYRRDLGHKKGIEAGRYPEKVCKEILKLLKDVEANAQVKGLNTANLVIRHIAAHSGGKPLKHGRKRGRTAKRTHVEIIVKEK
ncbi:50S ribosomal protein L22 [Candidatus Woesearchaeota archaeon]|nr:50S ribosomal protein L22 [Candidatus Woesearchaeota archaeon]RLE40883.1 MAG: 50S ribosomal protein L22 [Candidatus Woesearchaeota archaeon]